MVTSGFGRIPGQEGQGYIMEALSVKEIVKAVKGELLCGNAETLVSYVGTSSKEMEPNGLFVPIIGERTDAHDFIENAFENGAVAALTGRHKKENYKEGKIYIGVKDTKAALQILAAYYRNKFALPVIGITGSVGKTTTKEMIAAALETKLNVLKTTGNMNSQVGVALMMFQIEKHHDVAVIEMGISEAGEMKRLAKMAVPELAVVTNIGVSHIAQLKSQENIRKEKLNIINEKGNGLLYVCGNDSLLREVYEKGLYLKSEVLKEQGITQKYLQLDENGNFVMKKTQKDVKIDTSKETMDQLKRTDVIAYGSESFCAYRAADIKTVGEETHFVYHYPNTENRSRQDKDNRQMEEPVVLGVLGIHNVYNAVVALAVAEHFGISAKTAKEGLREYQPIAMRGEIYGHAGMKIIDDSYNASPDSMKSGIQVLLELEGAERRIAVLADVLELGEHSRECHYGVGEYIAGKKIDALITVGQEAKTIAAAVNDKCPSIHTESFTANEDAVLYLREFVKKGDAILVKGSRGMHMEQVVAALREI